MSSETLQLQIRRRLLNTGVFGLLYLLVSICPLIPQKDRYGVTQAIYVVAIFLNLRWLTQGLFDPELRRQTSNRQRLSINLITSAFVFTACSILTTGIYAAFAHRTITFPSIADAFVLFGYAVGITGLLMLPCSRLSAVNGTRILLDALMTATAAITFGWYFLIAPQLHIARTPLQMFVGICYPIVDFLVFFCVLVMGARPGGKGIQRARAFMTAGFLWSMYADVYYVYDNLQRTYVQGQLSDIGSLFGVLLIGLGTYIIRRTSEEAESSTTSPVQELHHEVWQSYLPYAVLPATLGLLLYVVLNPISKTGSTGVILGCVLLIGLMLLRQFMAIKENFRLNNELHRAHNAMAEYTGQLEKINEELHATQEELVVSNKELAESNERLEALAITDGMTGLPNHRYFQESIHLAEKHSQPTVLLLIDVDKFKHYNDSFGHPAGDEALRIVARLLRENTRPHDLPARYGGEEFAVLLQNTSEMTAMVIAERIRAAVASCAFPHREVTVSIGVSVSVNCELTSEQMIAAADSALYRSKNEGRNRVSIASVRTLRAA